MAHADELTLPTTEIQGSAAAGEAASEGYQGRASSTTTKLGLTDKQTPQAVTTLTREQLDDFKTNDVRQALRSAPSVTVEQIETDRTYFTSRGFDISNFQFDGMGMPFVSGSLVGGLDMAEYEQVDILHGANGLMSGAGNPSATVNFVRKRPTDTFQAKVQNDAGSWDNRRLSVDVSGPLTPTGNVRGRFIYAHDKGNSWMDRYSHETNIAAGLLAIDLSEADTLTLGLSQHNSDANGSSWGNLALGDANGPLHYSGRSASIGQPWTYWNLHTQRAFAELKHDFGNGWNATLNVSGVTEYQDTNMLYVAGVDTGDASLFAAHTTSKAHELLGEAKVSGPFTLLGREHELTVGSSYGYTHQRAREYDASGGNYYSAPYADVLSGNLAKPAFDFTNDADSVNYNDTQKSLFAGARFSLMDDLHWIAGARMLSADGSGDNYGAAHDTRVHGKVTPYTGLVYDLTPQWSVYGSWTRIFDVQYKLDANNAILPPLEGKSMEVGIEGALLDERLNVTAALFKTEQQNVAQYAGFDNGHSVYDALDYKSRGIELQASGEALPGLNLLGGYTYVHIEDEDGARARRYVPTHTFRGMASYRLPGLPQAKVGARMSWQSAVENQTTAYIHQSAYALVDLMADYDIDSHWSAGLNFNNITDRKYLLSLYDNANTASYGAPRNVTASLTWKY
ncbi:TonB-dependent siderophore receptor [Pseudomonas sp. KNUC1026]|uniref:TonB-dependent siderophore receptor n=1 Tax=Pseudomonas sp. KNUC1026 TaxID=2893890 RepID=UPI001F346D03|nr:TonB-dependent siderophore receptor [Pseudomonas sp. KNUC1026]UFH51673.1 TonB-dependent siderophore receptor [Pseudomonas sp. KNUC1026]